MFAAGKEEILFFFQICCGIPQFFKVEMIIEKNKWEMTSESLVVKCDENRGPR